MKAIISLFVFIFLAGCHNQQKEKERSTGSGLSENKNPCFEFSEEIHNFGTRKAGDILTYTFVFRNSGQVKLELGKTESGCACLEIHYDKKVIEPGKEGNIHVTFNTEGLYGKQFQAFRIMTATGTVRKDLAVTADIINENIQFQ